MVAYKVGDFVQVTRDVSQHGFPTGKIIAVAEVVTHFTDDLIVYICEDPETERRRALTPSEIRLPRKGDDTMDESKFTREEIVLIVSTVALYLTLEQAVEYADFSNGAVKSIVDLGTEMRKEAGALDGVRAAHMLEDIAQKLLAHGE